MSYAPSRSVLAELRIGAIEGSACVPGKDWGGPADAHKDLPDPNGIAGFLVDQPR